MLPGFRSLCNIGGFLVCRCSIPLAMLRTMDTSLAESHRAAALWCSMTSKVPLGQYSMTKYTSSPRCDKPLKATMLSCDPADQTKRLTAQLQRLGRILLRCCAMVQMISRCLLGYTPRVCIYHEHAVRHISRPTCCHVTLQYMSLIS